MSAKLPVIVFIYGGVNAGATNPTGRQADALAAHRRVRARLSRIPII
jgi:carboxylesterase type B